LSGAFGFLIHVYDLFSRGVTHLAAADLPLILNVLLPILLIYYGFKAYRQVLRGRIADSRK